MSDQSHEHDMQLDAANPDPAQVAAAAGQLGLNAHGHDPAAAAAAGQIHPNAPPNPLLSQIHAAMQTQDYQRAQQLLYQLDQLNLQPQPFVPMQAPNPPNPQPPAPAAPQPSAAFRSAASPPSKLSSTSKIPLENWLCSLRLFLAGNAVPAPNQFAAAMSYIDPSSLSIIFGDRVSELVANPSACLSTRQLHIRQCCFTNTIHVPSQYMAMWSLS
jgi:hypothetical protein